MMHIQLALFLLFVTVCSKSQSFDSVYHQLQPVEIRPESKNAQLRSLASEATIKSADLQKKPAQSLLPALNTVPGVRMEERSPGSYRLSIRGSLLRSPFGVRNIKIYLGDLPFTDAGGNAYLNSLDIGNINGLKILKGPEASIFGTNTGGVLLIDPVTKSADSLVALVKVSGGSYGLFHENVCARTRTKKSVFTVNQGYHQAEGYRKNSAMQRLYTDISNIFTYREKSQLRFFVLFSDLAYQTPGALTAAQYFVDPMQARPQSPTLPGAVQQKAAVYNKTVFGGITHDFYLLKKLRHVISVYGSRTNFENPFITNYEQRKEHSFGTRTYIEGSYGNPQTLGGKWDIGAELQQTNSDISNFGNNAGYKAATQATDRLNAQNAFAFARLLTDIKEKVLVEISASYNFFSYLYKNVYPVAATNYTLKRFNPQFMPRIAASYKLTTNIAVRASAARGYSPPTLAEIRSSDNVINKSIQPESGINYETGFRIKDNNSYFWLDASVIYYRLKNAIVRRVNESGIDYFVNAGGTRQPGMEAQFSLWLVQQKNSGFIRSMQIKANLTRNFYTFDQYEITTKDYSGNQLTGVPDYTSAESISVEFPANISFYAQYYYSSSIPLNDDNSEFAEAYHLLQLKAEWKITYRKMQFNIFAGVDNVLNEAYSLGNDLNAVGGRYYNAAMPRNYYGGLKIEF